MVSKQTVEPYQKSSLKAWISNLPETGKTLVIAAQLLLLVLIIQLFKIHVLKAW